MSPLLDFVRSRLPMVEHDFRQVSGETKAHAEARNKAGRYALGQAFFYCADVWVERPVLVSTKALAYANERWGKNADKIWTLKREEIPKVDGCSISQSGLILEHVTTGLMFREYVLEKLSAGNGTLDAEDVANWLQHNFQTAWITREENDVLNNKGYKSKRGASREDALEKYRECGIELANRPAIVRAAPVVHAAAPHGGTVAQAPVVAANPLHALYNGFFAALGGELDQLGAGVQVRQRANDKYAPLRGVGGGGVRWEVTLEAGYGGMVRTPYLSICAPTGVAYQEPDTPAWGALQQLFGGWEVTYRRYAKLDGRLCCKNYALTDAFDGADPQAIEAAAHNAAASLVAIVGMAGM